MRWPWKRKRSHAEVVARIRRLEIACGIVERPSWHALLTDQALLEDFATYMPAQANVVREMRAAALMDCIGTEEQRLRWAANKLERIETEIRERQREKVA